VLLVGLVSVALLRDKASTRTPATITSTRWRRHAHHEDHNAYDAREELNQTCALRGPRELRASSWCSV